jgi:hypothetical protein
MSMIKIQYCFSSKYIISTDIQMKICEQLNISNGCSPSNSSNAISSSSSRSTYRPSKCTGYDLHFQTKNSKTYAVALQSVVITAQ